MNDNQRYMLGTIHRLCAARMVDIAALPPGSCFVGGDTRCHVPNDIAEPNEARRRIADALESMAREVLEETKCHRMRRLMEHAVEGAAVLRKEAPPPGKLWAVVLSVEQDTFFIVAVSVPERLPVGTFVSKGGDA